MIKRAFCSLYSRSEDHLGLPAVDHQALRYVVLSWTRKLCLFGCLNHSGCPWLLKGFLPGYHSDSILSSNIFGIINFVITWTHTINCYSSKSYLIRLLLNELPSHVFFISKDAQMTWNGRRIHDSRRVFWFSFFECQCTLKLISLTILLIWARTWLIALVSLISILKPLLLGLKVTTIFDDLNAKAFQSLTLQMFHLRHCLFNAVKTHRNFVLPRSRMMLGPHLILQVLFVNHDFIVVR